MVGQISWELIDLTWARNAVVMLRSNHQVDEWSHRHLEPRKLGTHAAELRLLVSSLLEIWRVAFSKN